MEVYGDTIAEAWEKSVIRLLSHPSDFVPTEMGTMAKEIRNMIIHVSHPLREPRISEKYCFPNEFREHYVKTYFSKYSRLNTIYSRIFESKQIQEVIHKLKKNWFSRRGIISIWKSSEDLYSFYPPCICMIQVMLREGKLHMTAILRSNDAWLSALPDMVMISSLQNNICDKLGVPCGEYVHHAVSYHIYDYDYQMAREVFSL